LVKKSAEIKKGKGASKSLQIETSWMDIRLNAHGDRAGHSIQEIREVMTKQ
jgi:hypothetical protein